MYSDHGQVVNTHTCASVAESITWCRPKVGDALRQER